MERKAQQKAREHAVDYEPVTERGQRVQEAKQQHSLIQDARERFTATRTTYSEVREIGFSRMRSAYEAAREALLFGVRESDPKVRKQQHREFERRTSDLQIDDADTRQCDQSDLPAGEPSMWDALDNIGREATATRRQSESHDAMHRVQEQSDENQRQRETEAKELERQKLEREQERKRHQNYENDHKTERALTRQVSVWDALDGIGCEQTSPSEQSVTNDTATRIQERTAERQMARERQAKEIARQQQERKKHDCEQEKNMGLGYGL